jgi:hypothetical protein
LAVLTVTIVVWDYSDTPFFKQFFRKCEPYVWSYPTDRLLYAGAALCRFQNVTDVSVGYRITEYDYAIHLKNRC